MTRGVSLAYQCGVEAAHHTQRGHSFHLDGKEPDAVDPNRTAVPGRTSPHRERYTVAVLPSSRHLFSERNESFSDLSDSIRQDFAKQYLSETDFRLEQIAYLNGYSEPAALVRAFKRWTGTTPMQFRAKHA